MLLLVVAEENLRGLIELRSYRQSLIAKGEKLTVD